MGIGFDSIIAILSLVISMLAVAFVWHQSMIMRQHNRMSIRPRITIGFLCFSEKNGCVIKFHLMNSGVGPGIVENYSVYFDKALLCDSSEVEQGFARIDTIFKEFAPGARSTRRLYEADWSFPAGHDVDILALRLNETQIANFSFYRDLMLKFDFIVNYRSIYDEPFTTKVIKANNEVV